MWNPRIYRLAAKQLEVSPDTCLYVKDGSDGELSGAIAAGMCPVLFQISLHDAYDVKRKDLEGWEGHVIYHSSLSCYNLVAYPVGSGSLLVNDELSCLKRGTNGWQEHYFPSFCRENNALSS